MTEIYKFFNISKIEYKCYFMDITYKPTSVCLSVILIRSNDEFFKEQ